MGASRLRPSPGGCAHKFGGRQQRQRHHGPEQAHAADHVVADPAAGQLGPGGVGWGGVGGFGGWIGLCMDRGGKQRVRQGESVWQAAAAATMCRDRRDRTLLTSSAISFCPCPRAVAAWRSGRGCGCGLKTMRLCAGVESPGGWPAVAASLRHVSGPHGRCTLRGAPSSAPRPCHASTAPAAGRAGCTPRQ